MATMRSHLPAARDHINECIIQHINPRAPESQAMRASAQFLSRPSVPHSPAAERCKGAIPEQRFCLAGSSVLDQAHHNGVIAADKDLVSQTLDLCQRTWNQRHLQHETLIEFCISNLVRSLA